MLKEILSTGVAIVITGSFPAGATARGEGVQAVSTVGEPGEARLTTFAVLSDSESDATLRCDRGFEVPDGGVFCGPISTHG